MGQGFTKGTLDIMLDRKDRFYPGEMITGRVIATTKEKFEAKCLQLSIIGMEHYQYEDTDDQGRR